MNPETSMNAETPMNPDLPMNPETFVSLLQFSDGLFPVGAYAHSFGLESYIAAGTIRNASDVQSFLLSYLQGSVAPTDVVAALASRKAAQAEPAARVERCLSIDRHLDAVKSASELRDASRQMGRQVLRIATNLGEPFAAHGLTSDLLRAVNNEDTPGHHAMAFGAVGGVLGWPESNIACAYLYSSCAGLVAAALRLWPLGQLAGQRILWALGPAIVTLAQEVQGKDLAEIWSFAPAIEIAAMRHATLDARLFRS
jgi:urease accessory protein